MVADVAATFKALAMAEISAMARGVPRSEDEKLLVRAFLAEALSEIADPAAAEAVEAQLGDWLGAMR